ncbi:capsule-associated protein CAP1 [Xylographa bjoerkii]|nr:capsule-associated protein CAP1 [Xylographa bjoerkii]
MKLNSSYVTDLIHVLQRTNNFHHPSTTIWVSQEVLATDFTDKFDVQFYEIKNCAEVDCNAQLELFNITEMEPQEDAWKARYLLDMDGNVFSGRFYASMRSRSLPLKLAYFREWHWERLRPWVHFVPVSREVREVPELVRYFEEEEEGQEIASRLAKSGHEWPGKVLRKEDMRTSSLSLGLHDHVRILLKVTDTPHFIGQTTSRAQRQLQQEDDMPENDTVPTRRGHDRWIPRHQRGRAYDGPPRRNTIPQTNRLNHNPVNRSNHSTRSSYLPRQSHSFPPNRRNSTTNTPYIHRPYTAPSHSNSSSDPFRDIHNPRYHNRIRALISEGSLLSRKLQDFLKDIEFVLKSDPEEMDWDHTSPKEIVTDGKVREEDWEEIGPEVKNPFDGLVLKTTLTMRERRNVGQEGVDARSGAEESQGSGEGILS